MKNYSLFFFCLSLSLSAQDTISLQHVVLSDTYLHTHRQTQAKVVINDSILEKYPTTLTSLLSFESPIYFKENGRGMVSSPSFRGTTASQTAVIWNGININSSINGQLDFNTQLASSQDQLTVLPGGGSVGYGTGAIGGSIHLENQLDYAPKTNHHVHLGYGSFDTWNASYHYRYGDKKTAVSIGFVRNQSDNDYTINRFVEKNKNGRYYLNGLTTTIGHRFNANHELRVYSNMNWGERQFSLIGPYDTPTKYTTTDNKLMAHYLYKKSSWQSELKMAYLGEQMDYFSHIHQTNSDELNVDNFVVNYYLSKLIGSKLKLSAIAEYINNQGSGDNLKSENREFTNFALLATHQLSEQLTYEASIRQNFSNNHKQPLTFSLGTTYRPINGYQIRANISKNYRLPTFNDLFWKTVGNEDLKPESAMQYEIGQDLTINKLSIQTNLFYNTIKDMIRWEPKGNLWRPINTSKVETYGAEIISTYQWNNLQLKGIYAYTVAKDLENHHSLIYVPKHKATLSINYHHKNWSIWLQNQWNSQVYTQSNNAAPLKGYTLSNLGIAYQPTPKISIGGQINNLFNQQYQSVNDYWQPRLNYALHLTLKL